MTATPDGQPAAGSPQALQRCLRELGAQVIQRDWLSSNHIVFAGGAGADATVVDTGFQSHAEITCALIDKALHGQRLARIVNTHLHSDHCGGNQALQARHGCSTAVPVFSFEAVRRWDEEALTYEELDQPCPRFAVDDALVPGTPVRLGPAHWQVIKAGGHDDEAVMFFQPDARVLIAGDALWQHNVGIIFSELKPGATGQGFEDALATLSTIEALAPQWVIPGHGAPFAEVAQALQRSRQRLQGFQADPRRHPRYATRALVMFKLLAERRVALPALLGWMEGTPLFRELRASGHAPPPMEVVESLAGDGIVQLDLTGQTVSLPT